MIMTSEKGRKTGSKYQKKHKNSHAREVALQGFYQMEIADEPLRRVLTFSWLNEPMGAQEREFCAELIEGVAENQEALDGVIASFSRKDMTQISTIVRSILRMGIFEIMRGELDSIIIIDDLLNLTRKYDGEESVPFVNGILDAFDRERKRQSSTAPVEREEGNGG
jgi:N utilization substance protein B